MLLALREYNNILDDYNHIDYSGYTLEEAFYEAMIDDYTNWSTLENAILVENDLTDKAKAIGLKICEMLANFRDKIISIVMTWKTRALTIIAKIMAKFLPKDHTQMSAEFDDIPWHHGVIECINLIDYIGEWYHIDYIDLVKNDKNITEIEGLTKETVLDEISGGKKLKFRIYIKDINKILNNMKKLVNEISKLYFKEKENINKAITYIKSGKTVVIDKQKIEIIKNNSKSLYSFLKISMYVFNNVLKLIIKSLKTFNTKKGGTNDNAKSAEYEYGEFIDEDIDELYDEYQSDVKDFDDFKEKLNNKDYTFHIGR